MAIWCVLGVKIAWIDRIKRCRHGWGGCQNIGKECWRLLWMVPWSKRILIGLWTKRGLRSKYQFAICEVFGCTCSVFFYNKSFPSVSGLLTNDGKYEDLKYGKARSNSKASHSLIDQIRKVGLFILLGPGLATLSFLRLLLLICIVSSSR